MSPSRVVLCTVPSEQEAERLARLLLERRLIGCANIVPGVRSLYRWEGKIEDDREWLLVLKTDEARWAALLEALQGAHPYDTPEVLALPVVAGAERYLRWLSDSLG